MELAQAAAILLGLRLVSTAVYLYIIFKITYPNLSAKNDPPVRPVRWVLFALSIILLGSNMIPILVDAGTIWGDIVRSTSHINLVSATYTFNNAVFSVVASLAFLFLFVVSGQANIRLKARNKTLQDENDELHREANR